MKRLFGCCSPAPSFKHEKIILRNMGSSRTLNDRLAQLLSSSDTHDVFFVFDNPDAEIPKREKKDRLAAHKVVLASGSTVFKAMFYGPLAEKKEVTIVDATPESFKTLLNFIYTDRVEVTLENVGDILYLSKKYDVVGLRDAVFDFIGQNLGRHNCISFHESVSYFGEDDMIEKCLHVMDVNAHYIINTNAMVREMNLELMETLLKRDTFCAREIDIMDAIIWWAKHKEDEDVNKPRQDDMSPSEVRQVIDALVPLIRFPNMTMCEFVRIAVPVGVLKPEEVVDVLASFKKSPIKKKDKGEVPAVSKLFNSTPRMMGKKFTITQKDFTCADSSPTPVPFERISSRGFRNIRFKVTRRLFLTRISLNQVPFRVVTDSSQTVLRVMDADLNEIIFRADYALKRGPQMPPRPGRYDLALDGVELCPKVAYEILVSVEKPKGTSDVDFVKHAADDEDHQDVIFTFERYGRVFDEEMMIDEMDFMY